jgi:hypothetical protein
MYLDHPTLNALLLFAIAFGSFVSASIIHRDAANGDSTTELSLASTIKATGKQPSGD